MKPHAVREQMTKGLQRRLIGPLTNTPEETSWPGEFVEPKVVDDKFSEPKSYPTGPWVGPNGEEVLPDPPKNVYLVGTLGPSMLMTAMEQMDQRPHPLLFMWVELRIAIYFAEQLVDHLEAVEMGQGEPGVLVDQ
jgi:hypothetical protein